MSDATRETTPPVEAQTEAPAAGADGGAPTSEVEALKKERDELFDRLARVSAEFQNFQKRTQRDRAKWTQDAVRDVLSGLLSVFDSIDFAAKSVEKGADAAAIKQGIDMVREDLRRNLGNQGVTAMVVEKGAPFDPEKHQAIAFEEVPGLPKDEVSFVARNGYLIGDQVLRPAQVAVKKAVAAAAAPPPG